MFVRCGIGNCHFCNSISANFRICKTICKELRPIIQRGKARLVSSDPKFGSVFCARLFWKSRNLQLLGSLELWRVRFFCRRYCIYLCDFWFVGSKKTDLFFYFSSGSIFFSCAGKSNFKNSVLIKYSVHLINAALKNYFSGNFFAVCHRFVWT